jgi:O-acetyl-ADP-ribose deacetylase (regulator of RNase III)
VGLIGAGVAYAAALATFERLEDTIGQARMHRGLGRLHVGRYDVVPAARPAINW